MKQLNKINDQIYAWKLEDVESDILSGFDLFRVECIDKNQCFNRNVLEVFIGISLRMSNVLISAAAGKTSEDLLEVGIPIYYRAQSLHYKMLKKHSFHKKNSEFYALGLSRLGFLCCIGIYLEEEEVSFWCKEYIKHIDSEYNCPFSVDKDFMLFCYQLAKLYIDGKISAPYDGNGGIYNSLFEAEAEKLISKVLEALNARVESAYLQLVKNKNIEPTFYNTEFPALFPFEILAFMKLANIELNVVQHPLLDPFKSRKYLLPESYKSKFDICEKKIATL